MSDFEDTPEPSFSLQDFKQWMSHQKDQPTKSSHHERLVGLRVESKVSAKRLLHKICAEEGEVEELAKEFKRDGGVILEVDDNHNLLIEVDSGSFTIPRFFVRKS